MQVKVDIASWERFIETVDMWRDHGIERFIVELRAFAEREEWTWMPTGEPQKFRMWARVILQARYRIFFNELRRFQLIDGGFNWWVFRASEECEEWHGQFNGLCLRPDHEFWQVYMPPINWDCWCKVSGAHSEAGRIRVGGNPEKSLPENWRSACGVDNDFKGQRVPEMERVIELLIEGFFDGSTP